MGIRRDRRPLLLLAGFVLLVGGCSSPDEPVASPVSTALPAPTTVAAAPTTVAPPITEPVLQVPIDFVIPVGPDGVTYEDGSPPSGPTSVVVLADGSVVVADTMAAVRGEPRLLIFDRTGVLTSIIDLADFDVASVVDLATDGSQIALLDVDVSRDRYTVLTVDVDGELNEAVDVPLGFRFADGLTGVVWDDSGVLLEFEFGVRYASLNAQGGSSLTNSVWDGTEVAVSLSEDQTTAFRVGSQSVHVARDTELGGAHFLGIGPDGSVVVVLDEVEVVDGAFHVRRTIQRYGTDGDLLTEVEVDISSQAVDIPHPLALAPDGSVVWLDARSTEVHVIVLDV